MTPHAAAVALDLPADSRPEQIEARFLELRAKLEDKIAKAPTPGLKEKYRANLEEITTAFETLTLAADSSALPVLNKDSSGGPARAGHSHCDGSSPRAATPAPEIVPAPANPKSKTKTRKSGTEFLWVAIIALAVLGAGGWWVLKTKAENEEKARVAAEQKAEAERQAQLAREQAERDRLAQENAAKAEKERQERLFATLRSKLAELNVAYDALMRTEQLAERELAAIKGRQRDIARETRPYSQEPQRLAATVRLTESHVAWLRELLPANPAKVARAQAEELLSARALTEAEAKVKTYADAVDTLGRQVREAQRQLAASIERATGTINAARAAQARRFWGDQMLAQPVNEIAVKYMPEVMASLTMDHPLSREDAVTWMADAADSGDLRAMNYLATAYATGWGTKVDQAKALALWRRAAEAGQADAMSQIASAYDVGWGGTPKDAGQYAVWVRRAAEAGSATAQSNLGFCHYRGLSGFPNDPAIAVKWWSLAAAQGHGRAMSWLATAYEEGRGVPKDAAQSAEWLTKAVAAGDVRAYSEYGTALWQGTAPFTRDDAKAVEFWRKAADGGIYVAMTNLAYAYQEGRGVEKNPGLALEWRQKAARAGYEPAQKYLRDRGLGW